jgi:CoA-disulfide reductase
VYKNSKTSEGRTIKMDHIKVIIVGGVAGGASAAARLRRMDEHAEIILFEKGEHISFANCGLPYYVGEIIKEKERLIVQTAEGMQKRFRIDVRTHNEVIKLDLEKKEVEVLNHRTQETYREKFDKLIMSPGAEPIRPPIPGIDDANLFTLRNIPDTYAIKDYVDKKEPKHAVVVGGGFIGLEMAENLHHRGIKVTVVEMADQVMAPLDYEMACWIHQHMKARKMELCLGDGVESFSREEDYSIVELKSGRKIKTDFIVLAIGVRPEIKLARKAGLEIGERNGIKVNKHLQTSHPDVYAIGDAIEVMDFVNGRPALIPLAGPANKQGRIAANHICGIQDTYKATQGTSIIKIFDLTAASTGNNEKTLKRYGIPYKKSYTHSPSHAGYYPGSVPMAVKLLFSPQDGKILGAQIVGYDGVDKRIDVLAAALRAGMTVYDLQELELAYAPPFSSAKDPVNMAGYVAANILNGDHPIIHWDEINQLDPNDTVLVDVRTRREYRLGALPNSINIPLDTLRDRLQELSRDKNIVVYCQVGLRGYLAARILMQSGFQRIFNLSGGYRTYRIAHQDQFNKDSDSYYAGF